MRTQPKEGTARRERRAALTGVAALAIAAGLALPARAIPSEAQIWPTAEAAEGGIEYIGSTAVTPAEAAERASETRAEGDPAPDSYVPGHVVIQMFPGASEEALRTAAANAGVQVTAQIMRPQEDAGIGAMYVADTPAGMSVSEAMARLLANTQVKCATPDMLLSIEGDESPAATDGLDEDAGDVAGVDGESRADEAMGGVAVETAAEAVGAEDDAAGCVAVESAVPAEAAVGDVATGAPAAEATDPATTNGDDWAYSTLDYEGAWAEARKVGWNNSSSVTVAVMDTGINTSHEDLQGNIATGLNFWGSASAAPTFNVEDVNGHGTAVAGIISSQPNKKGTVGISNNAKILPMVVTDLSAAPQNTGVVSTVALAKACNYLTKQTNGQTYAATHGIRVVNVSAGEKKADYQSTNADYTNAKDALASLSANNILVVNSAGNKIESTAHPEYNAIPPYDHWPTSSIECIGVIALKKADNDDGVVRLESSNYNPNGMNFAQLSAPGYNIYTTDIGGSSKYTTIQGTSSAAPFVSGTAALMFAVCPSLTASEVKTILQQTATDLKVSPAATGFDAVTGYGMINPKAAVAEAVKRQRQQGPTATYAGLDNMKLRLGGESISDFDPTAEPYGYDKDCGRVSSTPNTTVSLYGYDTSAWRVANVTTSNSSQPSTDDDSLVEYTRIQRYTLESLYNGAGGTPLSRTYVFTTTWTMPAGSGVQAEEALAGAKVSVGGQEYADFDPTRHSYEIQYPSKDAMPGEAPQFSNLPAGWTAAVKGEPTELPIQRIDNGDGTYTERGGRSYVVTVTGNGTTVEYTFNYTYSQKVEGAETQAEAQSEAPQAPASAQPAVESAPAAKSAQQGSKGSLLQTGDPVVIAAVCILAVTLVGGIVFLIVKKKRSA